MKNKTVILVALLVASLLPCGESLAGEQQAKRKFKKCVNMAKTDLDLQKCYANAEARGLSFGQPPGQMSEAKVRYLIKKQAEEESARMQAERRY